MFAAEFGEVVLVGEGLFQVLHPARRSSTYHGFAVNRIDPEAGEVCYLLPEVIQLVVPVAAGEVDSEHSPVVAAAPTAMLAALVEDYDVAGVSLHRYGRPLATTDAPQFL